MDKEYILGTVCWYLYFKLHKAAIKVAFPWNTLTLKQYNPFIKICIQFGVCYIKKKKKLKMNQSLIPVFMEKNVERNKMGKWFLLHTGHVVGKTQGTHI